jgi:1-acyl-sn-glycerol-3-phosphate acyltransferase
MTYEKNELCFHPGLYRNWRERVLRYLRWMRLDAYGLDKIIPEGPALIAPNHLSWKDIPFIVGLIQRPVRFVANFRLFKMEECKEMLDEYLFRISGHPVLERALRQISARLACFLVSRVSSSGAIPAKLQSRDFSLMDSVIKNFRRKKIVCIFPEGRDSPPGDLGRFKLGIPSVILEYYTRYKESIPVYPVGLWGTHKALLPGMRLGLHVGDPLFIEDHLLDKKNRTLINFAHELRKAVVDCMDEVIF